MIFQDATLKRCFGKPDKIIDRNWAYISEQRTIKEPHEPMPRLDELLRYLASSGQENTWLLLDLKVWAPERQLQSPTKQSTDRQ